MLYKSKKILEASTALPKLVEDEILSIQTCQECYKLASDHPTESFTMVCKTLHPVVWAQSDGYNYWPAKAMKFDNNSIHVRYFGDHELDMIPLKNCYNFSRKSPDSFDAESKTTYTASVKVCVLNGSSDRTKNRVFFT